VIIFWEMIHARTLLLVVLADAQRELLTKRTWAGEDECSTKGCNDWCVEVYPPKEYEKEKYCDLACNDDAKKELCKEKPVDRRGHCLSYCETAAGHKKHKNHCKSGCDFWCAVKETNGKWVYRETISGPGSSTYKHGRSGGSSESVTKTTEWSISASANEKFEFDGASVSGSIGGSISKSYSSEFEMWDETDFTINFDKHDIGKALYQFVMDVKDNCGHELKYETQEYALVPKEDSKPCCLPRYADDVPAYQKCKKGSPNLCKSLSNLTVV
jgi:hypothetical protein